MSEKDLDVFRKLSAIGEDVASIWGGTCKKVTINPDNKEVTFHCMEHGERFTTSMSYDEIEHEYGLKLA